MNDQRERFVEALNAFWRACATGKFSQRIAAQSHVLHLYDIARAAPRSADGAAERCYAIYRKRPDENDGKEFFYCAMWHDETRPDEGERRVAGYFVPDEAIAEVVPPTNGDERSTIAP